MKVVVSEVCVGKDSVLSCGLVVNSELLVVLMKVVVVYSSFVMWLGCSSELLVVI